MIEIINPHGDVLFTIPDTSGATTPTYASDFDEYGNSVDGASGAYGWIGGKQRLTNPNAGLVQMGVRPYNPATGQFTSVDPVYGGNSTPYSYPSDPVTGFDLTGRSFQPGGGAPPVNTPCADCDTTPIHFSLKAIVHWAYHHRSAILHTLATEGADSVAVVLASGLCAGTGGIGCFATALLVYGTGLNVAANGAVAGALHEQASKQMSNWTLGNIWRLFAKGLVKANAGSTFKLFKRVLSGN